MASVSSFPAVDDRKLPSSGHNPPYWSGFVHVNSALWPVYPRLAPGVVVPEGAIAVEFHHDLNGDAQQIYAMEKRAPGFDPAGGDWEYLVLQPGGAVETRGPLAFCARCHAEAPHDHLFGPRVSARRHILQGAGANSAEPPVEDDGDGAAAPDEDTSPGAPGRTDRPKKRRKK